MLKYKSHKTVEAAKIIGLDMTSAPGPLLVLEGGEKQPISDDWVAKRTDALDTGGVWQRGELGYFVRYADGYTSWSPAEAFETGYTVLENPLPGMLTEGQVAERLARAPAPLVSRKVIESRIAYHGFVQIGDRTTLCQIALDNGYTVLGESTCVNAANFDREVGEFYSYKDAFEKLWPLFGFLLAEAQHQAKHPGFANVMATANAEIDKAEGEVKGFEDVSDADIEAAAQAYGNAMHRVAAGEVGDGI